MTCQPDNGSILEATVMNGTGMNVTHTFTQVDGVLSDTAYTCYVTLTVDGVASGHSPVVRIKTVFVPGNVAHFWIEYQLKMTMLVTINQSLLDFMIFFGSFFSKYRISAPLRGILVLHRSVTYLQIRS